MTAGRPGAGAAGGHKGLAMPRDSIAKKAFVGSLTIARAADGRCAAGQALRATLGCRATSHTAPCSAQTRVQPDLTRTLSLVSSLTLALAAYSSSASCSASFVEASA